MSIDSRTPEDRRERIEIAYFVNSSKIATIESPELDRLTILPLNGTTPVILTGTARALWNNLADKRTADELTELYSNDEEISIDIQLSIQRFLDDLARIGIISLDLPIITMNTDSIGQPISQSSYSRQI